MEGGTARVPPVCTPCQDYLALLAKTTGSLGRECLKLEGCCRHHRQSQTGITGNPKPESLSLRVFVAADSTPPPEHKSLRTRALARLLPRSASTAA
jgi:hypothetical protein